MTMPICQSCGINTGVASVHLPWCVHYTEGDMERLQAELRASPEWETLGVFSEALIHAATQRALNMTKSSFRDESVPDFLMPMIEATIQMGAAAGAGALLSILFEQDVITMESFRRAAGGETDG